MSGPRRWVAVMPLRGGSRSIPGKNTKLIAGRPLYAWALEQALASGCFDEVVVCSDCAAIRASVCARFGAAVTVTDRSPGGASDTAPSEAVLLELIDRIRFDVVALVQATSPLTRAEDFIAARRRFERDRLDSLVTGVPTRRFLWSAGAAPLNYHPAERPRRQDMAPCYVENGAFYLTRRSVLVAERCRLGGRIGLQPMDPESFVELDEPDDWPLVERQLQRRLARARLATISVLAVDVDGTLTDGGMYYDGDGERLKRFDTRDAHGLGRVAAAGIRVCVISAEDSAAVRARMARLGIADYYPGVADKGRCLRGLLEDWGQAAARAAFIGDDEGDLTAMGMAGFTFCPADAQTEVRDAADYVCRAGGGRGAVREACEVLLQARR